LPHSEIHGSTPARGSPWLFAACHVFHRLLVPRHPPNALIALEINGHRIAPTTNPPCAGTIHPRICSRKCEQGPKKPGTLKTGNSPLRNPVGPRPARYRPPCILLAHSWQFIHSAHLLIASLNIVAVRCLNIPSQEWSVRHRSLPTSPSQRN
jgi:hypothetical protein